MRSETKGAQQVDEKGHHLGIGRGGRVTDKVTVKLEELPQASALLSLIAETGADIEPSERLWIIAVPGGHHAGQRRGHLGAKSHPSLPLVGELIELT